MFDEHVIEREAQVGVTLESLRDAIDSLLERGMPQWSEFHVAGSYPNRKITARWLVEQCWADKCERVGVRVILPNEFDDPYAKFCDKHDWSDVSDEDAA